MNIGPKPLKTGATKNSNHLPFSYLPFAIFRHKVTKKQRKTENFSVFTFHFSLFFVPLQRKLQGTGCSAVGSAHVWGARGRKFESCHPDLRRSRKLNNKQSAPSLFIVSLEAPTRLSAQRTQWREPTSQHPKQNITSYLVCTFMYIQLHIHEYSIAPT